MASSKENELFANLMHIFDKTPEDITSILGNILQNTATSAARTASKIGQEFDKAFKSDDSQKAITNTADFLKDAFKNLEMANSTNGFAKATAHLKDIDCDNAIELASGYASFYEALENHNMFVTENKTYHDEARLIAHSLSSSSFNPQDFPNIDWIISCNALIDQAVRSSAKLGIDPYISTTLENVPVLHTQNPIQCTEFGDCFIRNL